MTLHNIDIAIFTHPSPPDSNQRRVPFIVHLETFQKTLFTMMGDGAANAGETATSRRLQMQVEVAGQPCQVLH